MDWALNKIKLQRAIAKCGANASEEDIKAAYVSMGGLVEGETYVIAIDETGELPVEVSEEDTTMKVVKKAKKAVKKK